MMEETAKLKKLYQHLNLEVPINKMRWYVYIELNQKLLKMRREQRILQNQTKKIKSKPGHQH